MDSTRTTLPLALLALAACSHELTGPKPSVTALDPSLVCTEQLTTRVTVKGDGLSPLAEDALTTTPLLALPAISLRRTKDLAGAPTTDAAVPIPDDPKNPAASRVHWSSQQSMAIDIFPGLALAPGSYDITVVNPNGQSASAAGVLAAVPPPVVTSATPNPVCNAQGTSTITLHGSGFLVVGGTRPTVAIDGKPATVTGADGCTPVMGTTLTAEICTSLTLTVPQGTLTVGTHAVTVQNPAPAACSTEMAFTLTVEPPPTITAVVPTVICAGGADLVITGTNFSAMPKVSVGGVTGVVTDATPTTIHATLGAGLTPGSYDLVVDNGDGCSATKKDAITVTPGPAVYFVDPQAVYNGISVQATIYVSGLIEAPTAVTITPAGGGTATPLTNSFDPLHPNHILAVVPAGLAAGDYDVNVTAGNCLATLPSGLHVTATLTLTILDVVPPFAWTSEDTAVTIDGPDMTTAAVGFEPTPRVYLTPHAAAGTVATPLAAVVFVSSRRLTAVVPAGLPAGHYDLIVVNPDRSVGLLADGFEVTAADAPPPTITTLTPGSVVNQPGQAVTVLGDHFRQPAVIATCADDSGAMPVITATGVTATTTTIAATFDMSPLSSAVCVVRVTNADGTYADFSALAVSNPAQNLPPTVADNAMATPRRALAAAAGRVTSQARYLYAVGGDDGTDAGLLSSIEAAPVSLFGVLDPFFTLPAGLPAGRSLATAVVVGRFVYLVGGHVAAGATDSVLRAELLDPRAAPQITDLDLATSNGVGLDPGLWYYRVSAVVDTPSNPGGETLASDPLGVVVPPLPGKIKLTLFWAAVPGATGYRVYRTTAPDKLVGDALLVAAVPGTQYVDTGAPAAGAPPLPEGALGAWHEVGPLPSAREGAGVTVATGPTGFFFYAIGGRNAGGALDSYSFATITVADDGSQTVGNFAADTTLLATARWQLGAVAMDHEHASIVPEGDTWIYAMGGYNAGKTSVVASVTAAKVGANGTLGSATEVKAMSPGLAGYGYAVANNFLFAFGGVGGSGAPGVAAKSAKLSGTPPDLVNWNDLSFTLTQARYLPGSALESAFIFLVGGASDTAAATTTTERTHW